MEAADLAKETKLAFVQFITSNNLTPEPFK
jgi:hypothetical protein